MKLLSFNLLPVLSSFDDRLDALGKLVQSKRPEFLALQNVTKENLKKISGTTWGARYNEIHPFVEYDNRMKPTVAIFSTFPAQDQSTMEYHESSEDRVMQKGYYVLHDKSNKPFVICVGTTILENELKSTEIRERQLNEACLDLVDVENAFLVGNFGLDNDIDGEIVLQGGWSDAWLSFPGNMESNGYTYDPEKNALVSQDPFGPGRPNRLFFKSRNFKLDGIEIVGVEPYQLPRGKAVTISKHYGLLAQLTLLDDAEAKPKMKNPPLVSAIFKRTEWSVNFKETNQET